MKLSDIKKMTQNLPEDALQEGQGHVNELIRALGFDPSDLYQELEMESRFVDTHQDITPAGYMEHSTVQLHSHRFYELLFFRSTAGVEYLVGADRYKLQKGDVIFVPPDVSHRPIFPEQLKEAYIRDVLWISEEFFEQLCIIFGEMSQQALSQVGLLRTAGTRWEYLGEFFHQGIQEAQRRDLGWELAVLSNTANVLTHLLRASQDISARPLKAEKPELLDQVLKYVEQHLAEKITMADVAHHFFISESTITQTFRKKMGVSFYRCVTQRRLIAAKALIERGIVLESVAEQVGFSDYSSFFRAFKQEYGISPRQYRKISSAYSEARISSHGGSV